MDRGERTGGAIPQLQTASWSKYELAGEGMARPKPKSSAPSPPLLASPCLLPSAGGPEQPRAPSREPVAKTVPAGTQEPVIDAGLLDVFAYQRDLLERSILFLDTLRKRAN